MTGYLCCELQDLRKTWSRGSNDRHPRYEIYTVPDSSSLLGMGLPDWSLILTQKYIYIFPPTCEWSLCLTDPSRYLPCTYSFELVRLN